MLQITIPNNKFCVLRTEDYDIIGKIRKEFSYKMVGFEFTQAYREGGWNGITYLLDSKGRLPLGLLNQLTQFLSKINYGFEIDDHRPDLVIEPEIDLKPKLEALGTPLRDYQERIVNAAFEKRRGIVRAATGAGKSLCIAALCAKINKPTIIYVIGLDLLQQFHNTMTSLFNEPIGFIGNGICDIQRFNVASVWTIGRALGLKNNIIDDDSSEKEILKAENNKSILELLKKTEVHILDECHYASTATIKEIHRTIDPVRIYGFSATPTREDGSEKLSTGLLGDILVNVPASELIEKGILAKPHIKFIEIPKRPSYGRTYHEIYSEYIVNNPVRNNIIVDCTKKLQEVGLQTLVLFKQINHGKILLKLMQDNGMECEMLYGDDSLARREEIKEQLKNKELNVVLASTIFDQGVDAPSLSALVLAGSGKSLVRSIQRIGRILRKYEGKKNVAVIDFYDQERYLKQHSKRRYEIYSQEPGFEVIWPKTK